MTKKETTFVVTGTLMQNGNSYTLAGMAGKDISKGDHLFYEIQGATPLEFIVRGIEVYRKKQDLLPEGYGGILFLEQIQGETKSFSDGDRLYFGNQTNFPNHVRENFGCITSILYHVKDEELEYEFIDEVLKKHPRFGLGFNISIRKKAYEALKWVVEHPEVDYSELDSWNVRDSVSYFKRMNKLYDVMMKYRFYENKENDPI